MKITETLRRVGLLATAGAVAAGSLMLGATNAQAAVSPKTASYCSGLQLNTACTITITQPTGRNEGQTIAGVVRMRPNIVVSLRAFEVQWDPAGKPSGVKAIGPAFSVTTDATGRANFTAPTQALTAPSTGGSNKFLVQASDFTATQWRSGTGILGSGSIAPTFELRSARAQVYASNGYGTGDSRYYLTNLRAGITGHQFTMQIYAGGRWVDARSGGSTTNGVVDTSGLATLRWAKPASVGTGVYQLRLFNLTKGIAVSTSKLAVYLPPSGVWGDQDGDRRADILAVDSYGVMRTYITRSGPTLSEGFNIGSGWGSMTWVSTLPDMDGNGRSEMLARRNDGTLWLYKGTDFGAYGSAIKVGSGWTGLDQLTILPDISGDKAPEMLARTKDGRLLRYRVTLSGAAYVNQVGTGWDGISRVISLGDLTRDGIADVTAIGANGNLYRYALNRNGQVFSSAQVGRGWTGMTAAFSPGDMDGDGTRDLVGRRSDGLLFFYENQGNGSFGAAKQVGSGWNGVRLFT
ncbi:FG-GAP repeat domain-containing protein [Propionibacteriaceae bacterium G1746]